MSELQETKLDMLKDNFIIAEKMNESRQHIELIVAKIDTDNLRFEYKMLVDVNNYGWEDVYVNTIKEMAAQIGDFIVKRHYQNINRCTHDPVMIGNAKACNKCMGKFGTTIPLDINFN